MEGGFSMLSTIMYNHRREKILTGTFPCVSTTDQLFVSTSISQTACKNSANSFTFSSNTCKVWDITPENEETREDVTCEVEM
jgi:hypothetical protein